MFLYCLAFLNLILCGCFLIALVLLIVEPRTLVSDLKFTKFFPWWLVWLARLTPKEFQINIMVLWKVKLCPITSIADVTRTQLRMQTTARTWYPRTRFEPPLKTPIILIPSWELENNPTHNIPHIPQIKCIGTHETGSSTFKNSTNILPNKIEAVLYRS